MVSYVSHATQQRLQNLVEKVSETAQQKNFSYKVRRCFLSARSFRAGRDWPLPPWSGRDPAPLSCLDSQPGLQTGPGPPR